MELSLFISESIRSIFKAVSESQGFAKENGGRINPIKTPTTTFDPNANVFFGTTENARPLTLLEFDIAVTSSAEKETGIKGGINVMSLNVGGASATTNSNETVSRIKFALHVVLPHELS